VVKGVNGEVGWVVDQQRLQGSPHSRSCLTLDDSVNSTGMRKPPAVTIESRPALTSCVHLLIYASPLWHLQRILPEQELLEEAKHYQVGLMLPTCMRPADNGTWRMAHLCTA
jgi:hypothetical protein